MKFSLLSMVMAAGSVIAIDANQQAALDAHNAARAEVGTPALVWDEGLAASAANWASHLVSLGHLEHSGAGENLYMQGGGDNDAMVNAVGSWNSEKELYNGEILDENNYMIFGHYTQVVWDSTTSLGMAQATNGNGETFVVAHYAPPGNWLGETPF